MLLSVLLGSVLGAPLFSLDCQQISQLTQVYFRVHYSAREFNDEISRRTLKNLINALDPGKLYFLQQDVDRLKGLYELRLDDMVRRGDCSVLNDVLQTYASRFERQQAVVAGLIHADYDFSIEEYFEIDRKKRAHASTQEELDERWRKQVKLQTLRLRKTRLDEAKVREKLEKRYELGRKYLAELDSTEVASIFLNAFSRALDPHSTYMPTEDLEDFRISTGLSLDGIGAVLRSEYGVTVVQSLVPGGPAEKGGELTVNDKIVAVAQGDGEFVDVVDQKLRDVVKHIRGKRGTMVRLSVVREEKDESIQKEVGIIRDKIELKDREAKGHRFPVEVIDADGSVDRFNVGLIQLPSFYIDFEARKRKETNFKSSSADVRRIIGDLGAEGIDALIVDLRYNSGGSLDESIAIAGLFFDSGPVVQVRNANGSKRVLADRDKLTYYDGPLIQLVNRQSASSSEILAGAIQDYGRGLIVGDSHTFGKGTVQKVEEIGGGKYGAVKVTISQFFRPSGSSTQLRGVESDIVLPNILDEYEIGEEFYDYVLPWNTIGSAAFDESGLADPYVRILREKSEERVSRDPDFRKRMEEIEEYRSKKEERTRISLAWEEEPAEPAESGEAGDHLAGDEAADNERDASADETDPAPLVASKDGKEPLDGTSSSEVEAGEDRERGGDDALVEAGSGKKAKQKAKRPDLEKDIVLRETIALAADYVQYLKGRSPAVVSFPDLEPKDIEVASADIKPDDDEIAGAGKEEREK